MVKRMVGRVTTSVIIWRMPRRGKGWSRSKSKVCQLLSRTSFASHEPFTHERDRRHKQQFYDVRPCGKEIKHLVGFGE